MIDNGNIRILCTGRHKITTALVGRISTRVPSPAFRGKRKNQSLTRHPAELVLCSKQDAEHLNVMAINK